MAASRQLLDHVPVIQNQGLRGTSAWANLWLGRDHSWRNEKAISAQTVIRLQPELQKEMNRKLHIVGELMNNSYARARKAFNARDVEGYRQLAKRQIGARRGVI